MSPRRFDPLHDRCRPVGARNGEVQPKMRSDECASGVDRLWAAGRAPIRWTGENVPGYPGGSESVPQTSGGRASCTHRWRRLPQRRARASPDGRLLTRRPWPNVLTGGATLLEIRSLLEQVDGHCANDSGATSTTRIGAATSTPRRKTPRIRLPMPEDATHHSPETTRR